MGLLEVIEGTTAEEPGDYMLTCDSFATAWPDIARDLKVYLRGLGVSLSDVDDIVQETAARALANGLVSDGSERSRRWCFVVAKRIAIDGWREAKPLVVGVVPDRRDTTDIVHEVAARQALRQFRTEVERLPTVERGAILSRATSADDPRTVASLAVARHRARRKLAHIMEGLAAVVGGLQVRLRRLAPVQGALAGR